MISVDFIQNFIAIIVIFFCIVFFLRYANSGLIGLANLILHYKKNSAEADLAKLKVEEQRARNQLVVPDQRGFLPVPRVILDNEKIQDWSLRQYAASVLGKDAPSPMATVDLSVKVPDFFELWQSGRLPSDNRFFMGYDSATREPVYATFNELRSTMIGGQPGSGKSTLVRMILVQAVMKDSVFAVIDPHADSGEDSLAGSFYSIQDLFFAPVARTHREQLSLITKIEVEMEHRLSGRRPSTKPLLLIVDEISEVLSDPNTSRDIEALLNKIYNQGRKAKVYAITIGQSFHNKVISTVVRNSTNSYISCMSRKEVARMLSGDPVFAEEAAHLKVGQAVWLRQGMIVKLDIPNVTPDVASLILTSKPRREQVRYAPSEWNDRKEYIETEYEVKPKNSNLNPDILMDVKRRLKERQSMTTILTEVWGVPKGGSAYVRASQELQEYIAELME